MVSLLRTLLATALGRPPSLVCAKRQWNEGIDELRGRAGGRRESGAFLLGSIKGPVRRIEQFLYYDDVDPHCLDNGMIEFDGRQFGAVWEMCRARKLTVVADVHVHPGHYGQSWIDRGHPMIAEHGHLALILPDYAAKRQMPGHIGIYEYLGSLQWRDHSAQGGSIFHVGWWPR